MTVWRRSPVHPLCLLVGALLFGSAGLAHPSLTGAGPRQLAVISATPGSRTTHWALLFGLPVMVPGLAGLARHCDRGDRRRGGGGIHRVLPQHVLRPGARRRVVRPGGSADAPGRARARVT